MHICQWKRNTSVNFTFFLWASIEWIFIYFGYHKMMKMNCRRESIFLHRSIVSAMDWIATLILKRKSEEKREKLLISWKSDDSESCSIWMAALSMKHIARIIFFIIRSFCFTRHFSFITIEHTKRIRKPRVEKSKKLSAACINFPFEVFNFFFGFRIRLSCVYEWVGDVP